MSRINRREVAPGQPVAFGRLTMVRKFIAIIAVAGGIALSACNTVEGAGRDVESVDETVQDAAD